MPRIFGIFQAPNLALIIFIEENGASTIGFPIIREGGYMARRTQRKLPIHGHVAGVYADLNRTVSLRLSACSALLRLHLGEHFRRDGPAQPSSHRYHVLLITL